MRRWTCRRARWDEVEAIEALQARSAMELGRWFYTEPEIEAYVAAFGTLDRSLILDGTFYVVEVNGVLVACGGWSVRTLHDANPADRAALAQIQGFAVDPVWARLGVGKALIAHIENAIGHAGHDSATLVAMLSEVASYRAMGYRKTANHLVTLPDGVLLPAIEMARSLADAGFACPQPARLHEARV